MPSTFDVETILATLVWADHVFLRSGAKSAHELEKRFRSASVFLRDDKSGFGTTGQFARYRRGDTAPSARVIREVDAELGDAGELMRLPLWSVMRAQSPGRELLLDVLKNAPPETHKLIFQARGHASRVRRLTLVRCEQIASHATPAALSTLLALLRLAELDDDDWARYEYAEAAIWAALALCTARPFAAVTSLLWARLRQRFLGFVGIPGFVDLALDRYDFKRSVQIATLDLEGWRQMVLRNGPPADSTRRQFFKDLFRGDRHVKVIPSRRVDGAIPGESEFRWRYPRRLPVDRYPFVEAPLGKRARATLSAGIGPGWEVAASESGDSTGIRVFESRTMDTARDGTGGR